MPSDRHDCCASFPKTTAGRMTVCRHSLSRLWVPHSSLPSYSRLGALFGPIRSRLGTTRSEHRLQPTVPLPHHLGRARPSAAAMRSAQTDARHNTARCSCRSAAPPHATRLLPDGPRETVLTAVGRAPRKEDQLGYQISSSHRRHRCGERRHGANHSIADPSDPPNCFGQELVARRRRAIQDSLIGSS